jgi:hypothetical protein
VEADLIAIGNHQALPPIKRYRPDNQIVPGGVRAVPVGSATAVRHESPEVIGVQIRSDKPERFEHGQRVARHVKLDNRGPGTRRYSPSGYLIGPALRLTQRRVGGASRSGDPDRDVTAS